jgi:hypothetical protein
MDCARDGVPDLSRDDSASSGRIDLHLHSTASDGEVAPELVVARALKAGVSAIALTDHDTIDGVPAALATGERLGVRVIPGCEFSVTAGWGEIHLLAYFLPVGTPRLDEFLKLRRDDRADRGKEIVERLQALGLAVELDDVLAEAAGGAIGRPHVARALVRRGHAADLNEAFDRYVGYGRPGFVEKRLPTLTEVAALVHDLGGIVSAAHLKDRGTRSTLRKLKDQGLDAVETRHPSHDPDVRARLTNHALELGLLRTGGSDWHGDAVALPNGSIGSQAVPFEWLEQLEAARSRPREPLAGAPG